jgi:serine/threonine protein kinase
MKSLPETFINKPLVDQFIALWEAGDSPPDVFRFLEEHSEAPHDEQVAVLLVDQTRRWRSGAARQVEEYLEKCPEIVSDENLKLELIVEEYRHRHEQGRKTDVESFLERFPDVRDSLRERLLKAFPKQAAGLISTMSVKNPPSATESPETEAASSPESPQREGKLAEVAKLGRYRLEGELGAGAFGKVFLGYDEELNRRVAIKVPHPGQVPRPDEDVEAYLAEGRIVAGLDHPNIVPVYDIGRTEDGACYVVSKFIEGSDLNATISRSRLSPENSAQLMTLVADALSHAHRKGLVHRDIKPSNILLDQQGRPYVADFGLAVHEDHQRQHAGEVSGTPAYMAPEQVRGETHRLDGRSDIWSFGAVLYELLTGRRPFTGESRNELFDEIEHRDPKPPRQIDETIPQELERICLKCLAKQATQRYTTAADLADELRHWNRPTARASRRPAILAVSGLLLTVAVVVIAFVTWPRLAPPEPLPLANQIPDRATEQELQDLLKQLKATLGDQNSRRLNQRAGLPPTKRLQDPAQPTVSSEAVALPPEYADLEQQIKEARSTGDEDGEATLLLRATNELVASGHFSIAEALAERMVELAGNDPKRRPFAYGQLGLAQYRGGRAEEAIVNLYESIKVYRQFYAKMQRLPENPKTKEYSSHLARLTGITLMRIGNANKFLNRYQNAQKVYDEARQILEKHDRTKELVTLFLNYGSLESSRGNYQQAIDILGQGAQLARSTNNTTAEAEMLVNLGNTYSRDGNNAQALESYQAADGLIGANASYELRTTLLSNWSTALVEEGRAAEARDRLVELKRIARPADDNAQRVLELLQALLQPDASSPPAD